MFKLEVTEAQVALISGAFGSLQREIQATLDAWNAQLREQQQPPAPPEDQPAPQE